MADITPLEPWLNEPFRLEEVFAAVKAAGRPVTLSEVREATGLPLCRIHTSLTRLVQKGKLERFKVGKTYPSVTGGSGGPAKVRWLPNGRVRRVYLYSVVDADA